MVKEIIKSLMFFSLSMQFLSACVKSSRNRGKDLGPKLADLVAQPIKKVDASKLLVTYAKADSLALGSHRSLDLNATASALSDYVSYRISDLETGRLAASGRIYFGSEVFSSLPKGKHSIELAACVEQGRELNPPVRCGQKTSLFYVQDQNPDPALAAMLGKREDLSQQQKQLGSELSNLGNLFLSETNLVSVKPDDYEIVALSAVLDDASPSVIGEFLEKSDEIISKVSSIENKLEKKHQQLSLTSGKNENDGVNLAEGAAMLYVVGSLLRTFGSDKSIEAKEAKRVQVDKMIAALDLTIDAKKIQIQDLEKMTATLNEKIEFEKTRILWHRGYMDTLNNTIHDVDILKAGFVSEKTKLDQEKSNFTIERPKLEPGKWDKYARYGKRLGLMISVGLVLLTNFDERVAGQIDRNIRLFSFWLSEEPFEKRKNSFLISVGSLFNKLVDLKNESNEIDKNICLKIKC